MNEPPKNGYAQMLREYMSHHRIYTDHAAELLEAALIEAEARRDSAGLDVEQLAEAMMEALTPGFRDGPGSKGYKKLHRQRAERIAAQYLRLSGSEGDGE